MHCEQSNPLPSLLSAAPLHRRCAHCCWLSLAIHLQIDENMMSELKGVQEAVKPTDTLLVVDAMTGQEAAGLVKAFNDTAPLTGLLPALQAAVVDHLHHFYDTCDVWTSMCLSSPSEAPIKSEREERGRREPMWNHSTSFSCAWVR